MSMNPRQRGRLQKVVSFVIVFAALVPNLLVFQNCSDGQFEARRYDNASQLSPSTPADRDSASEGPTLVTQPPPRPAPPPIEPITNPEPPAPVCRAGEVQSCLAENGSGFRTCNAQGSGFGNCLINSCSPGYTLTSGTCVQQPKSISKVVAGVHSSCAIKSGALYCWGLNSDGQLGDGTRSDRKAPFKVLDSGVTDVALSHSQVLVVSGSNDRRPSRGSMCAVVNGSVICWGSSYNFSKPSTIIGSGFSQVALARHAGCGLKAGDVFCWNANYSRNLTPRKVLSGVAKIVATDLQFCGLLNTGSVQCWGTGVTNSRGWGIDDAGFVWDPVTYVKENVESISGGWFESCAVTLSRELICYGSVYGFTSKAVRTDVTVQGLPTHQQPIRLPEANVDLYDSVKGYRGSNVQGLMVKSGQLSILLRTNGNLIHTPLTQFNSVTSLSVGFRHACVVQSDTVYCFAIQNGYFSIEFNSFGELGFDGAAALITPDSPIATLKVNFGD